MLDRAQWLSASIENACPQFVRRFTCSSAPAHAVLPITARGVYSASLNGQRVGDFHLAPGWTVYRERIQVQSYDVTALLQSDNELCITVGGGWYNGAISRHTKPDDELVSLIAELTVTLADGSTQVIATDEDWRVRESQTRYADLYHGETFDATFAPSAESVPQISEFPHALLIPQQGEKIVSMEELAPAHIFTTPKGERVIDFGQEITGVVRLTVDAPRGTHIRITCAEMLDADGNFYTENYRSAKSEMNYICAGGGETWQPELTFYGFRYIRVEGIDPADAIFRAVVLCSDLQRAGWLNSGVQKLNRLFDNIIWGQKGNFVDVPTDCPQRDERLGWTGDAQVFANTACWQFDVKRFFTKWLEDAKLDQRETGAVPMVIPNVLDALSNPSIKASTAWGETATVCPWQIYRHYGDIELLRSHFSMMKKWVGFMTSITDDPGLWTGYGKREGHFGDWLGLDAEEGSYIGASDPDLLASAFYYYSTGLVVKAGHVLGEDVSEYEALQKTILHVFRKRFPAYKTQTECVLALHFGLAEDPAAVAKQLAELIHDRDDHLATGFVGTPYLLYALSENGLTDLAYTLLLQEEFPSWLSSVNAGATTIWEHWDGRKPDGSFWSKDMNSFNHYAYGSVAGWVFEVAAGITPMEPGFAKVRIAPQPDARLGWLKAEHNTEHGKILSAWFVEGDRVRYEITTPVPAVAVINGVEHALTPGSYLF